MITEYFDTKSVSAHDRFQAWRTKHQSGTLLAMATRTRANLHGVRCQHLGSGPPYLMLADGFGSLTIKRKVCGTEEELLAWAAGRSISVKRCKYCERENLLGSDGLQNTTAGVSLPGEAQPGTTFTEGDVQQILVNRYERDPRAREQCIQHYGTVCHLCGFDFVAKYGQVMAGFIHVHHLTSISSVAGKYEVDPIVDLRPVCANCHAVLHHREPAYSLEDVKKFLRVRAKQ